MTGQHLVSNINQYQAVLRGFVDLHPQNFQYQYALYIVSNRLPLGRKKGKNKCNNSSHLKDARYRGTGHKACCGARAAGQNPALWKGHVQVHKIAIWAKH